MSEGKYTVTVSLTLDRRLEKQYVRNYFDALFVPEDRVYADMGSAATIEKIRIRSVVRHPKDGAG